jgi:MFS family permease
LRANLVSKLQLPVFALLKQLSFIQSLQLNKTGLSNISLLLNHFCCNDSWPGNRHKFAAQNINVQDMYEKMWNRDFILLTLSNFFMCITYYALISALPVYLVNELHAGKSQVGLVLAAYTIASVIIRPFSGFALDKFGRRTVFLIALVFYTGLLGGYLIALSIAALIVLRFAQGLTWGVTTISGSTIAVDIIPTAQRGEGIGYFALSTTMGMSVGPVVGAFIIHHGGYSELFLSALFISLASLILAYLIRLPKKLTTGRSIEFSVDNLFHRKSILPSINLLIIMTTYGGLLSFIALFGREIGIENTSLFFLIFAAGIAISRVTAGKTFDRKGPQGILTFCLGLLIVGFPWLALGHNALAFYTSALIIGFGIGVVFPTFQTIVNNLANNGNRGAANSTLYTALDLGMGLGMIVSGLIAQYLSIAAVFLISTVICIVGLVFFRWKVIGYYNQNIE